MFRCCLLLMTTLVLLVPGISIAADSSDIDLSALFDGKWQMRGKFRYAPDADWISTKSELVAESKLGNHVVLREIEAPQINFSALDIITYNAKSGVAQYIYINSRDTSALYYEGRCEDGCRKMTFEQLCGPAWTSQSCKGTTEIVFESDSRFVARDYRPGADGKPYMTREVYYNRP